MTKPKKARAVGVNHVALEVGDIDEALEFCKTQVGQWGEEVFIIGGGEIYKQTLEHADQLYLTLIDKEYPGDAKYPDFEDQFIISDKDERQGEISYSFCLFTKK